MGEIKRTFLQGKMNKDLDERLIPDGQFLDALNVQVAKSEGGDVGAVENTLGNERRTDHNLTNARCIGAYGDNSNQLIYYFVTAEEKDFIAEYDDKSQSSQMLLESTRVNGKTLLNFQKDKFITGIVKVISGKPEEDLLCWTDDNEQPRMINIERAKTYGSDGFEEDDISLIKKPPLFSPAINMTYADQGEESNINDKFLSFAYAFRYLDGEVSALSPFSSIAFAPKNFNLDYQTLENEGMQNAYSAVEVEFNTGSKRVTDIILVSKESNSNIAYVVETFHKASENWGNDQVKSFTFSNNKVYRPLDENELYRLFDNVPRQAKALDFIGNRIALGNYLEGYDLKDKFGQRLNIDYNLALFTKDLSGNQIKYELLTVQAENDLITINLSGIELKKGTRLSFAFDLVEKINGTGEYSGDLDFIINEDFPSAGELAGNSDFIRFIEEVVTGDFLREYSTTPPENSELINTTTFKIDSYTPNSITVKAPTLTYQIDNTPADTTDSNFNNQISYWGYLPLTAVYFKNTALDSSCKTNRSYEAAIVYLDEYGRATTALTSPDNTLYIPQKNSVFQNRIRINVNHRPPAWAKYFRFALKQNKKEYQIIYASVFYEDGLFRWVKLDGANKDKVHEGDTLVVKSDLNGPLEDLVKVRVLEVKSQPEDFLEGNADSNDVPLKEPAGVYMKIKPKGFDMNTNANTFLTYPKTSRVKSGKPSVYIGREDFDIFNPGANLEGTLAGYQNPDTGNYVDYPMSPGTRVSIRFENSESDGYQKIYEKEFTVSDSYDNFELWWEAEVIDLGDQEPWFDWRFERNANNSLWLWVEGAESGTQFERSKLYCNIDIAFTEGIVVFETLPEDALSDIFYEGSQTFEVLQGAFHSGNVQTQDAEKPAVIELDFFNCYTLGDGIESYRFKDALNSKHLSIDSRPTAKTESEYREIRRYADITYSAPYVESLGINGLNNFNLSTGNYKDDIVKKYGYIQKILARDTDVVVFQEDKISRVLYGKELIVGPNGSSNLASIAEVLGSQVMYAGEHGVSRNPESIAMAGNRIYFADEKRNQVCRLAPDGITVISDYGMLDYFRDMFTITMNKAKIGGWDPYNQKYVLTFSDQVIYDPLSKIDCSQTIKKSNFSGTLKADIDFGLATGNSGISIVTDKEITVKLLWNGQEFPLVVDAAGSITFNKEDLLPRTAELTVEAPETANFTITGNCAIVEQLTVVSIVRAHASDAGTLLTNRYRWIYGSYAGNYRRFRKEFLEEGGVTVWDVQKGDEGTGFIPKTGSKILLESYKGYGDTGSFGPDDMLGYLVSNTEFSQAEVETIITEAQMISPEPEETEGGEVINRLSFNFLRPNAEKFLYLIWDYSSLSININTHIFIYFDSSGSMNTTLAPLEEMRDTVLKDALLPLYENDEVAYNEKVQVISHSSERTLHMLNFLNGVPPEGNVISLVFQDEANPVYNGGIGWTIDDPRTTQYNTDIDTLRNRLNNFSANYFRGVVFQVDTPDTSGWMNSFKELIPAIQNGTGQYSGSKGLADRNEFNYKYGVTPAASPQFYKDLIVTALQELGYDL